MTIHSYELLILKSLKGIKMTLTLIKLTCQRGRNTKHYDEGQNQRSLPIEETLA